jgi:mannan endo-1,4-beta-mannosidase
MKLHLCTLAALLGISIAASAADAGFDRFITAHDGKLYDGDQEFRFISWNIPNLLIVEDNFAWNAPNDWLLPNEFELTDGLATVRALGGTVVRTYSIPVQRADEGPEVPKYVRGIGKYDEECFRTMDLALKIANEQHVRLIIPLVNNWKWQGGRLEYAAWRNQAATNFWTDPQLISDFEDVIRYVLTRTNTLTGVRYADDKAILCWETGNELRGQPASWTAPITAFIKSVDSNHLVMDGYDGPVKKEFLDIPTVDIVTTHHYHSKSVGNEIKRDAALVAGKKPYIVGEFGFFDTATMLSAMQAIMSDSHISGGLLWSLRFRNRDGGFYWHSEPDGGNRYKAFHWPGSPIGDPYDEISLLETVRSNAFAIRGLPVPPITIAAPPKLLPITDPAAIAWQGSVGATLYQVERAPAEGGPWQVIASDVDEAFAQYRPDFSDENAPAGRWFYRVRAKNDAGLSDPSNVAGPVDVTTVTLVDELADFSRVKARQGGWQIANRDCRNAREDDHRAAGKSGDSLTYQLPNGVTSFRAYVYFPKAVSKLKFYTSDDGTHFQEIAAQTDLNYHGAGDYNYWKPALFHAENLSDGKYLKIELAGETQIGRVEISHPALPQ